MEDPGFGGFELNYSATVTFTWNGGGTSGNMVIRASRKGSLITVTAAPSGTRGTTGTSSTAYEQSSATPLLAWAYPIGTVGVACSIMENGTELTTTGMMRITSNGIISFTKVGNSTWTNSTANSGPSNTATISYSVT